MSDSIRKYNEMVSDGLINPSKATPGPLVLTEEQKKQAYRLLTEYDEKVIKFAFNKLMFG